MALAQYTIFLKRLLGSKFAEETPKFQDMRKGFCWSGWGQMGLGMSGLPSLHGLARCQSENKIWHMWPGPYSRHIIGLGDQLLALKQSTTGAALCPPWTVADFLVKNGSTQVTWKSIPNLCAWMKMNEACRVFWYGQLSTLARSRSNQGGWAAGGWFLWMLQGWNCQSCAFPMASTVACLKQKRPKMFDKASTVDARVVVYC